MQTTTFKSNQPASGDQTTPRVTKLAADQRGRTKFGWLDSRHSFSFGEYFDPDHMGYRSLRVINDDIVSPGAGFGMHPHRDAEIFTYVISGGLQHRDSMGNQGVIRPGNLQYMSAGDGVLHSEMNASSSEAVHFLQIWLRPNEHGGTPRYSERPLGDAAKADALTLLFAPEARDGAVAIRQDAEISFGKLGAGKTLSIDVPAGRGVWVHQITGELTAAGECLTPGDAVSIEGATRLDLTARRDAEFLVFVL